MRVLSRAGRRSAGLSREGSTRAHTQAVSVREHGEQVVCSAAVHCCFLKGRKYKILTCFAILNNNHSP